MNDPKHSELKIVQVISRLCVGGASIEIVLSSEAMLRRGYPTILLAGDITADEASLEEFARSRGVPITKISGLSRKASVWAVVIGLLQLAWFFRRERPAIVHTHTAKAGALGRIAARLAGVPICVHTFHGHVFRAQFSPAKTRIFLAIERLLARWTDCLVAVSELQRRELVHGYHVAKAEKVVTIPVGIELEGFLGVNGRRGPIRCATKCPSDHALVGWVGRMSRVKNPELFVAAAELVLAESSNARFVMIGDGELRARLESQIKKMQLGGAVAMQGWLSGISDFYADVDLVVLTSRHEGTPLVLLETMASGKPFIATDVGGIRDLMLGACQPMTGFKVFENGILTETTPAAVAAAITYLLEHPKVARAIGRSGREFASRAFSHHRLAHDIEELYVRLSRQKCLRHIAIEKAI
jgi:glycosyltransferase involved in cell wall biosynthesis